MKKTYKELGISSTYTYPSSEAGTYKKMTVSNTISSLNVISGENNSIKDMLVSINNVGSQVKVIEASAFMGCPNLKTATFKNPLWSIGNDAFRDCTNLKTLNLNSVNGLGDNAFRGTNIENLVLDLRSESESLSTFEYEGCHYTTLNEGPYVGDYCFADNPNLKTVQLCTSTQLGSNMFANCTSLSSVRFANHGQCVGDNVFKNCQSLKSIEFPENFEIYSKQMFNGCVNLTSINIPYYATKFENIEESSFQGCTSLTSLRLPKSISDVYQIDDYALYGSSIAKMEFTGISSNVFDEFVGHVYATGKFSPLRQYSDFKYGTWYAYDKNSGGADYTELETEDDILVKKVLAFGRKNFIPVVGVFCGPGCSFCQNLIKDVFQKTTFQKWMIKQPYLFVYFTHNTAYKWKLLRSCGFTGDSIAIPCFMKFWLNEDGEDYRSYKSRPGGGSAHADYAEKVMEYIPEGFEGCKTYAQFVDQSQTLLSSEFKFWGLKDGGLIESSDGIKYTYKSAYNWLEREMENL